MVENDRAAQAEAEAAVLENAQRLDMQVGPAERIGERAGVGRNVVAPDEQRALRRVAQLRGRAAGLAVVDYGRLGRADERRRDAAHDLIVGDHGRQQLRFQRLIAIAIDASNDLGGGNHRGEEHSIAFR